VQTLVQAHCSGVGSLRARIGGDDRGLGKFHLEVVRRLKPGRPHGWSKLRSTRGVNGAINAEWDAKSKTLSCRVITRDSSDPSGITGDFVAYLLKRCRTRIQVINVFPPN
jgi:hypothetical protein